MKKNSLLALNSILILSAIILMTLPQSAILVFSSSPEKKITKTFSYFNIIVLGYGNWFPFLTAVLSIVLLIIILWTIINQRHSKKSEKYLMISSVLCVITSFLSLLLFSGISIPGITIFILLLLAAVLQYRLFFPK